MKLLLICLNFLGLLSPALAGPAPEVRFDPAIMEAPAEYKHLHPFEIDKTEVTVGQLISFRQQTKFKEVPQYQAHFPKDRSLPANLVDWFEAASFCQYQGKRLPTQKEWELAAGVNRTYPWGEEAPDGKRANLCDKSCQTPWAMWRVSDGYERMSPVGSFAAGATPEGLLDMAGNLWEWTSTRPDGTQLLYKGIDQDRSDYMDEVIIKGGSYGSNPKQLKNQAFAKSPTNFQSSFVGFRCVKDVK